MNANLWTQLLIAIVPALITGVGSLIIAIKKCKNEINTLETNNKKDYIEFVLEKSKGYGNFPYTNLYGSTNSVLAS